MKFLRDMVTGADNTTHDVCRWAAALGTLNGLGLSAYDVIAHSAHFDFQSYGIGLGSLLAGVGAALNLKAKTEPGAPA